MKPGDIVKFRQAVDEGDGWARFKVLEVNGDRLLVEMIVDRSVMPIAPTAVYKMEDMELFLQDIPSNPMCPACGGITEWDDGALCEKCRSIENDECKE